MSWRGITWVMVAVTMVAGCGSEPGDGLPAQEAEQDLSKKTSEPPTPTPSPALPSAAIRFTSAVPVGDFLDSTEFPLHETLQIHVVVDWSNVPAASVQRLDLIKPNGLLYASATATVPADGRAVYTLQVAGTPVEMYGMTGTWTAYVRLEDAREPLAASAWTLY
jgi:hypothetical protein